MKTTKISDDLRAKIVACVETADLAHPADVFDAAIDAAENCEPQEAAAFAAALEVIQRASDAE